MRKVLFVVGFLFVVGAFFSVNAQNNKAVLGEWNYSVTQAPYGYKKGVISLVEKDKTLSGELILVSGYKVTLTNVSFKADTLRATVYVDSENVNVVAKVKDRKMEGTVDSSIGIIGLEAEKVAPEQKKK